jgi:hypothetical protein
MPALGLGGGVVFNPPQAKTMPAPVLGEKGGENLRGGTPLGGAPQVFSRPCPHQRPRIVFAAYSGGKSPA